MAVRIGVGMGLGGFPFASMREFHAWLDLCEASRIDSIWQSDRVVSREIALEPMTLLSVIAGATERLKFGTNAVVLPFRDPITFARQAATLDYLSDGRFLPTVAIGRESRLGFRLLFDGVLRIGKASILTSQFEGRSEDTLAGKQEFVRVMRHQPCFVCLES